ncbi:MAG: DUF924 domain-containing protein [Pseudomonadota bacterium]|nr:DUF924 domain-containing protein [Pseudomonadota bacterium]
MSDIGWAGDVLRFWFALDDRQWWTASSERDEEVRDRFCDLWAEKRQLPAESFLDDPQTALAGTILFDQFPRNMFRGSAEQFATDHLARAIADGAIGRGFDDREPKQRPFLYMPFMHSEDIDDQLRSLQLFTRLGETEQLEFARKHHAIIEHFGRFPHRNAILGRKPRAEEIAAGNVVPW